MNICNFKNKMNRNSFKENIKISINDGKIPYKKISNLNKITFIIITKDKSILQKSTEAIIEFQKKNKEKEITVFISSNYEKLHRLSNGML